MMLFIIDVAGEVLIARKEILHITYVYITNIEQNAKKLAFSVIFQGITTQCPSL